MAIRIGINPLTWTNDDLPELGGETPLEVCLTEARQAGYQGMEKGHKFPGTAGALRPLMERHGLAFVSGWYSASLLTQEARSEIAALAGHLALHQGMGSRVMVFAETSGAVHGQRTRSLKDRPTLKPAEMKRLGLRLTEVGNYLQDQGVRLAYHHHMGTVIESPEEIEALMAATGESVGLLLDTGHLTYAGGDPVDAAMRYGARIVHVHCKDVRQQVLERSKRNDLSFLDSVLEGVFTVPGDGQIQFPAVLQALKQQGYREGWLVVEAEQDPAKAHPLTYARMGFEYLQREARQAGLF